MARVDPACTVALLFAGLSTSALAASLGTEPAGASAPSQQRVPLACAPAGEAVASQAVCVSVWVVLEWPELASLPREHTAERDALRRKILAQQDEVMGRLRELGAVEQARVQQVRNALAVRLPRAQLDAARQIPGVRSVSRVRDLERGPLVHGD